MSRASRTATLTVATHWPAINYYEREKLVERTAEMGKYLMGELRAMQERQPIIGDVRGLGLFVGVELVANSETKEEIIPKGLTPEEKLLPEKNPMTYLGDLAKEKGLILGMSPGTSILRLMPSLIITKEQIDEGLKILEETIADMAKKFNLPKASS
jgi:4-aminobutyrate aminotransferase/(S)-3-amino-2-methylpropionate transaminase